MKTPQIGYWCTTHCWCGLQQVMKDDDLKEVLEDIKEGIIECVFEDLKDAEHCLDMNGGDEESKKRFFQRLNI